MPGQLLQSNSWSGSSKDEASAALGKLDYLGLPSYSSVAPMNEVCKPSFLFSFFLFLEIKLLFDHLSTDTSKHKSNMLTVQRQITLYRLFVLLEAHTHTHTLR